MAKWPQRRATLGSGIFVLFLFAPLRLQRVSSMTIPVFRQNYYDDWEVASIYDSDDCESLGRSVSYDSYPSGSFDDPAFQLHGPLRADTRPRADYLAPQSQPQHQKYPLVTVARSQRDTCPPPTKRSNFAPAHAPIVPPPGVIFPHKDWVLPPQDIYWPSTPDRMVSSPDMLPVDMALMEPPQASLLLSPSSPRAPSPQIRRASPTRTIGHSRALSTTSMTVSGPAAGLNLNIRSSPIMSPRYHEAVHTVPPRLADAGCQVHPGIAIGPRRPGHDVLSSYGPETSMPRGSQANEDMRTADERYGGHLDYGPADRPDLRPQYEHEYGYDAGRMRSTRPLTRERRPSVWQRFVRRFSQSRGVPSVGHT